MFVWECLECMPFHQSNTWKRIESMMIIIMTRVQFIQFDHVGVANVMWSALISNLIDACWPMMPLTPTMNMCVCCPLHNECMHECVYNVCVCVCPTIYNGHCVINTHSFIHTHIIAIRLFFFLSFSTIL